MSAIHSCRWGKWGLRSASPRCAGRVSFGEHQMSSLSVVVRTAPAGEDGVQLSGMKRPIVLTVGVASEPAQTSGAVEKPRRREAATRLANGERGDERTVRGQVLLPQVL